MCSCSFIIHLKLVREQFRWNINGWLLHECLAWQLLLPRKDATRSVWYISLRNGKCIVDKILRHCSMSNLSEHKQMDTHRSHFATQPGVHNKARPFAKPVQNFVEKNHDFHSAGSEPSYTGGNKCSTTVVHVCHSLPCSILSALQHKGVFLLEHIPQRGSVLKWCLCLVYTRFFVEC